MEQLTPEQIQAIKALRKSIIKNTFWIVLKVIASSILMSFIVISIDGLFLHGSKSFATVMGFLNALFIFRISSRLFNDEQKRIKEEVEKIFKK